MFFVSPLGFELDLKVLSRCGGEMQCGLLDGRLGGVSEIEYVLVDCAIGFVVSFGCSSLLHFVCFSITPWNKD